MAKNFSSSHNKKNHLRKHCPVHMIALFTSKLKLYSEVKRKLSIFFSFLSFIFFLYVQQKHIYVWEKKRVFGWYGASTVGTMKLSNLIFWLERAGGVIKKWIGFYLHYWKPIIMSEYFIVCLFDSLNWGMGL